MTQSTDNDPGYVGQAEIGVGTVEDKGLLVNGTITAEGVRSDQLEYEALKKEVEFLRFFYGQVEGDLGPASDDIYEMIKGAYVQEGGELPEGY